METLSSQVQEKSSLVEGRKAAVEEELAEVQPLILEARKSVGNIKQSNIDELRFLKAPPEPVRHVLQVSHGLQLQFPMDNPNCNCKLTRAAGRALHPWDLRHLVELDEVVPFEARGDLGAVGGTVIDAGALSPALLKHLLKADGGCSRMTALANG